MNVSSSDGPGCLWSMIVLVFFWACLFGVTYKGVHYGIDLSCKKGVVVQP